MKQIENMTNFNQDIIRYNIAILIANEIIRVENEKYIVN